MKINEKSKAIALRRAGKTYSEILGEIPVAKSTLSEWFKSVHLAKPQEQRISQKRIAAALRGSQVRHQTRINEVNAIERVARTDIGNISPRELWLIGIALYWAEGSKQYEHSPSTGVIFNNSDSRMVRYFLKWLEHMKIPASAISFELYVHETRKSDVLKFKSWWASELGISVNLLDRVYFKKGNPNTRRKHVDDLYHGLIRIKVNSSTTLNRKIAGWVRAIVS